MVATENISKMVKYEYVNGSIWECKTRGYLEMCKADLIKTGWTYLCTLDNLIIYFFIKDKKWYWFTLVDSCED